MRGIAGLIRFDAAPVEELALRRMLARMTFGAYAWSGTEFAPGAGLAAFGQNDVPEDRFQHQPLKTIDGAAVLVTDALLANRDDLARTFGWSAEQRATAADSAFVRAAYEHWGEDCADRLEGHFALVVWRPRERRLFCAVDACSFRPLYYAWSGGSFAFASTLRGLLAAPDVSRRLNESVLLHHLLSVRRPDRAGETLYAGVQRLAAAHTLAISAGGSPVVRRYWRPDPARRIILATHADYVAAFRRELEQAVDFALRTTGNAGVLLSGGLDSTAVTVTAAHLLARQGRRLQVFHRIPATPDRRPGRLREHDESAWVRMLEPALPEADFHYYTPQAEPTPVAEWDRLFDIHQAPIRGVPMQADPILPRLLAEHNVTTLTNGLGGNYTASLELLPSGYLPQLFSQGHWWRWWREMQGGRAFYRLSGRQLLDATIAAPLREWWTRHQASPVARSRWFEALHPRFAEDPVLRDRLRAAGDGPVAVDAFRVKPRLARIVEDLIPQHVGFGPAVLAPDYDLDSRPPLLGRRLNAFCLGVPVGEQIRDGRDRLLMRDLLAGQVPEALRWRITRGLPNPAFWSHFLRHRDGLLVAARELREVKPVVEFLRPDVVERFLTEAPARHDLEGARIGIDLVKIGRFLRWLHGTASP
jgi:asparagine synthase (glutamine-hydrolysing)